MKTFITILIVLVTTSCNTQREWTVKGYTQDYSGNWLVQCESGKKVKQFLIECRPDSVGARFKW